MFYSSIRNRFVKFCPANLLFSVHLFPIKKSSHHWPLFFLSSSTNLLPPSPCPSSAHRHPLWLLCACEKFRGFPTALSNLMSYRFIMFVLWNKNYAPPGVCIDLYILLIQIHLEIKTCPIPVCFYKQSLNKSLQRAKQRKIDKMADYIYIMYDATIYYIIIAAFLYTSIKRFEWKRNIKGLSTQNQIAALDVCN